MVKLHKSLGFWAVFAISSGAMISSGIFILPGLAFAQTGPAVFVAYLLAGLLALSGAFGIAELASAMPRAGGDYFFASRTFGPALGTIAGFLSWTALIFKTAFAIFGLAELLFLWLNVPVWAMGLGITFVFMTLNIIGVKEAARIEILVVFVLLGIMLFFIIDGLSQVNMKNFDPFIRFGSNENLGFNSILMTAGLVFVSYGGLVQIASISEEVKNPKKNIPSGIFTSILVVVLFYVLMLVVVVGVLPGEKLSSSLTPIADAAQALLGRPGYILLSVAAMLAFVSTANAGMMAAARYPYALSEDGLMPGFFKKISAKKNTPYAAIIITALLMSITLFLPLEFLAKAASTVVILSYILVNLAVLVLRHSRLQNYQPAFKTPLFPWLPLLSTGGFIFLMVDMGLAALGFSGLLVFIAVLIYVFYGRKVKKREYALLHVLERLTNKALTSHSLEKELRQIIVQRDEIQLDRFDQLLHDSLVLDWEKPQGQVADLFQSVGALLQKEKGYSAEVIAELLKEREAESPTALNTFVAIPHIILPGEKRFELVLVRCREGAHFSESYPSVKAIFIILGTKDKRPFHLQTLAALAQIVQIPEFEKRWLEVKHFDQLKEILLTAERKRAGVKN